MTHIERVLLVRHGQTDWNVDGRWQGVLPVGLNTEGWSQARALAASLRGRPIGAIYSSDLPRALETATVVGSVVGLVPHTDIRLREFNLGVFQGLTREQIEDRHPAEWQEFRTDYWNYVIPQGESRRALQLRVQQAFTAITAQAAGKETVLVSHGGAIRMLLLALFANNAALRDVHIENTSVTTLERNGDDWRLAGVADIAHLNHH
jgi:2,3-bisphosphoglycerate-dependent phosphoglycerate mutase